MVPSLSCPYCNSIVQDIETQSVNKRLRCPRCGETFPLPKDWTEHDTANHLALPSPASNAETSPDLVRGLSAAKVSNRTIALGVLAFMGLIAIVFLGFALQTQEIRREHDLKLPKSQSITIPIGIAIACNVYIVAMIFAVFRPQSRPGAMPVTVVLAGLTAILVTIGLLRVHIRTSSDSSPAEDLPVTPVARHRRPADLPGLRYLPADSNVIAAVQVKELMETPAGREWLSSPGRPEKNWNWQQIQNWTGLKLEDIDYMVAGLKLDDNLIPRLILVVETIRPFEVTKVRDQLKTGKWPDSDAVQFPSDHTVVMALNKKDLQFIPKEGLARANQFITPLQTALRERIAPGSQVWAAGSIDDWERTVAVAYLAAWPKENGKVVKKIQTFAIGMNFDKQTSIQAAIQCREEQAAKSLMELLVKQKPNLVNDWKINQKENWVSFQANASDPALLLEKVKIAIPGKDH